MGDLYSEIRERSKQDYGQKFEEWAPRILVDQYSDRTHFIFELIQNAEDAGATYVAFSLYQDRLILCHNGKLFTEADIQGICGIRSTKDEPESGKIGRFGIGFKSVYAYTKTPRIYSGQYSFRICNLILPYAEENEATGDDTILILPFDGEVNPETAYNEIGDALKKYLSADVLFALCNVRNISCKIYPDESEWSVSKESVPVDNGVDKVLLTQKPTNSARKLLVFRTQDKQPILIGYELETDDHGKDRIIPTEQHYLYVFFQTAVETHQTFYIIAVVEGVVPSILTGLDCKVAFAAQFPRRLLVLCLNLRVEVCMVSFHDLGKLADVEHIAQTAHVKVIIIQMFQPCRKAAPIRVIHLYNSAIGNAIEVVIVAVDETNILRQRFRLPDAPSADARLRDVFEDLYAFLLDDLAVIVRKFKQIPVPGGRNGVPAIGRQVLFRDLPAFQRLTSYLVVGGKADACAILSQMQVFVVIDEINSFFGLFHQHPPSNSRESLLRPSASVPSSTVAL